MYHSCIFQRERIFGIGLTPQKNKPPVFITIFSEQFYPDLILQTETMYFVSACEDLTPEEQEDVKAHFVTVLNDNKVCKANRFRAISNNKFQIAN